MRKTIARTLVLCVISGTIGGVIAVFLFDPPETVEPAFGQTSAAQSRYASPASPVGQPPVAGQLPVAGRAGGYTIPVGPSVATDELTPEGRVNARVYEDCNRSVAHITTKSVSVRRNAMFMFRVPSQGEGSGGVLDKEGHVVTNFHVVQDAQDIRVTLYDGNTYEARPIGADPATDVAVIKVDAPPEVLYPLRFTDSSKLRVGQRVFAIGNPFGLERTLTTGIVSSLNRSLPSRDNNRTIKSIIQIDAAINPGNSGGPLLDAHGRMIGMNTAIASKSGESAGVGFAIPTNTIARVVPQLIENGRVVRPYLGLADVAQTDDGILVVSVVPEGPAEKSGLRGFRLVTEKKRFGPAVYETKYVDRSHADLIVGIDGKPATTVDELLDRLDRKKPGQRILVDVIRKGKRVAVPVTLEAED